jgi:hypothetical protein
MTALAIWNAVVVVVAVVLFGVSLLFGFAGKAHAHGTWMPPFEPHPATARIHQGPFSVLHQKGPFSVLAPAPGAH